MKSMVGRSSSFGFALAVFFVGVTFAILLIWPAAQKEQLLPDAADEFSTPLPGGEQVSLADAVREFELPIFRPSISVASDSVIDEVWVRLGDIPETYITYQSGIVLIIRPAEQTQPTKEFAKAQIADGVPGELVTIQGVEAFLISQANLDSHGSIGFTLDKAAITVVGDGDFTADELTRVAESILQEAEQAKAEHITAQAG